MFVENRSRFLAGCLYLTVAAINAAFAAGPTSSSRFSQVLLAVIMFGLAMFLFILAAQGKKGN